MDILDFILDTSGTLSLKKRIGVGNLFKRIKVYDIRKSGTVIMLLGAWI